MTFRTTHSTTFATRLLTAVAGLFLVAAAGCGDSADDSSQCGADTDCKGDRICNTSGQCVSPDGSNDGNNNGGDDNNNDDGTTTEAYCCLNGSFYECPTADAADACFNNASPGDCTRDSSRDGECSSNDGGGNDDGGSSGSDVGETCTANTECSNNICIVANSTDNVGYCSKQCESFSDCPSFWDCEEIAGATGTYCVDNS